VSRGEGCEQSSGLFIPIMCRAFGLHLTLTEVKCVFPMQPTAKGILTE
jgi:hypothetical protein